MTGYLLSKGGTQNRSAEELEERLAFLAAGLTSSVGDPSGSVGVNLLSKDLDEGLTMLREVLTAPRFQKDRIDLYKTQQLQAMKHYSTKQTQTFLLEMLLAILVHQTHNQVLTLQH